MPPLWICVLALLGTAAVVYAAVTYEAGDTPLHRVLRDDRAPGDTPRKTYPGEDNDDC